jgi:hypothetical protein
MPIDYDDPMMDDSSDEPSYRRPDPRTSERSDPRIGSRGPIRNLDRTLDSGPARRQDHDPDQDEDRDQDSSLRRREGKTLLDAIRDNGPKTLIPDLQVVQHAIDELRAEMQRSNETFRAEIRESNEILRQEMKLRLDAIERLLTRNDPRKPQPAQPAAEKPATVDEVRHLLAVLEGHVPRH